MVLALLLPAALAGERTFAHSYGYGTLPKGGVEVEHYATVSLPEGVDPAWEHQIELEYGITDRLEGGLYVVGEQAGEGPFTYSAWKARLRYRFGSAGVGIIDPAIYLEYIGSPTFEEHGIEAKLILEKDVQKLVTALNLEYKVEFGEGEIEHEIEPTLGAGYRITPAFTLGVEGKVEIEPAEGEVLAFVGPSVHLAGEGGKLWWTVAALAPIGEEAAEHDGVIVRSLVALNL